MAEQALTAVVTDKRKIEMRYFPVPKPSSNDAIELCGICGSGCRPCHGATRRGGQSGQEDFAREIGEAMGACPAMCQ